MTYYTILGVSRTCSESEIRSGYVKKQRKAITLASGELRDKTLKQIDDALIILSNPITRKEYDESIADDDNHKYILPADGIVFDYAKYRLSHKTHWSKIAGGDSSAQNILDLFKNVLFLPNAEIQLPILVSAIMAPSAMCSTLPLIFCWGREGSGKSLICKLTASIWNTHAQSSASSSVSYRNSIQEAKYIYAQGKNIERNCGLVINDLNPKAFANSMLTSILKAYNREESKIKISSPDKDGTNIIFDVFSNRITSSVHPFFAMDEYRELARRMIVVHCVKASSDVMLESITNIDFSGINNVFNYIWESPETCTKFVKCDIRAVSARLPANNLSIDRLDTVQDILKTGVALSIFKDPTEAIEYMNEFERLNQQLRIEFGDNTKMLLRDFIEGQLKEKHKFDLPQHISPLAIKSYLAACAREAKIEAAPRQSKINEMMQSLGYTYNNKQCYWS